MANKDGLDDIRIIIGREVSEQRAVRRAQSAPTTWPALDTSTTGTAMPPATIWTTSASTTADTQSTFRITDY